MTPSNLAPPRRKTRSFALEIVDAIGERVRDGDLVPGDKLPTEAALMTEFGVSRTVVREAISKMQTTGLLETRHGVGTFVAAVADVAPFRVAPEQMETLFDVIAVLELRIGVETEAAALAAARRTAENVRAMKAALKDFATSVSEGRDAVAFDFQFHLEIARATQNARFSELMGSLGPTIIPRARLEGASAMSEGRRAYLMRANAEHESILDAIVGKDAEAARAAMRTHLANSRERRRRAADAANRTENQRARARSDARS